VIALALQPDPVPHAQPLGHVARQLHPADPVQDGVLHRVPPGLAAGVGHIVAQRLAAGPPVPDGHGPGDLVGHGGIVGDDEHGHAQLGVSRLQAAEHIAGRGTVQLAGRLVGQQQERGVGQRGGDRGALLLAAGHLVGPPVGAVRDAQRAQQLR
jgi:hypothetical protein